MSNVLTHVFVSAKADVSDATKVGSSKWNDGHKFAGGANGNLLIRDTSDATYGAAFASGLTYLSDVFEQRNGTNAQALRLYNTFTDASNYERLSAVWSGNTIFLITEAGGSGTFRSMVIGPNSGAGTVSFQTAGVTRAYIAAGGGLGYPTGTGGTVTQATDKTTGVTLNTVTGQITTANSALAAGAKSTFTVTNSACATTDIPVVAIDSGGTANAYRVSVAAVGAGSFAITIENITAGSLTEQPVVSFAIIKGATS